MSSTRSSLKHIMIKVSLPRMKVKYSLCQHSEMYFQHMLSFWFVQNNWLRQNQTDMNYINHVDINKNNHIFNNCTLFSINVVYLCRIIISTLLYNKTIYYLNLNHLKMIDHIATIITVRTLNKCFNSPSVWCCFYNLCWQVHFILACLFHIFIRVQNHLKSVEMFSMPIHCSNVSE